VNQQLYCKIRELYEENDRLKDENFQLKYQLDVKTKKENMLENKVKALEKVACTPVRTQKENLRPITLPTPTTTTDSEVSLFLSQNHHLIYRQISFIQLKKSVIIVKLKQ
jgi:hypothetical protein